MTNPIIEIKFVLTKNPEPQTPAHLKHLVLEWARSKGAEVVDDMIVL